MAIIFRMLSQIADFSYGLFTIGHWVHKDLIFAPMYIILEGLSVVECVTV